MNDKNKNDEAAITLIALIVTIIVILILTSITLAILSNSNNVVITSEEAKVNTEISEEREKLQILHLAAVIRANHKNKDLSELPLTEAYDIIEEEFKYQGFNTYATLNRNTRGKTPIEVQYIISGRVWQIHIDKTEQETTTAITPTTLTEPSEINIVHPESAGARMIEGSDLNETMITLAESAENIEAFKRADNEPLLSTVTFENIATEDSLYPIYVWFNNKTIFWWSRDESPYLNKKSENFFKDLTNLTDISGLKKFDASEVEDLSNFLYNCKNLEDVDDLLLWDTSNLKFMNSTFEGCLKLSDIKGLKHWTASSVTQMRKTFKYCSDLEDIETLESWSPSRLTDTSEMFKSCTSLTTLKGLETWKTPKLQKMVEMYSNCNKLVEIGAIRNWNTQNVTTVNSMFYGNTSLTDVSALNNWNLSKVTDFTQMFYNCSTHPSFNNISGTWNNGTFTPNN